MKRLVLVLLCVVTVSCLGCAVSESYRKADQATFDAVAPEYRAYVEADPNLNQDQKERRKRTLATWKLRIDKGEE